MQVPSVIYGTYKEVNARLRKKVTRLRRGESWSDLMTEDGLTDTNGRVGLLVLNGPSPLLGGLPNFHCFLPLSILSENLFAGRLSSVTEEEIFESSLRSPWGILSLLSPANQAWVFPTTRHHPMLLAACGSWEILAREGERYTVGSATGRGLWLIGSNVKYVLANLGVPVAVLKAPLTKTDPCELLQTVDASLKPKIGGNP
jgi:hypothetical protein